MSEGGGAKRCWSQDANQRGARAFVLWEHIFDSIQIEYSS